MIRLGTRNLTWQVKLPHLHRTSGAQSTRLCSHVQAEFDISTLLVLDGCTPVLSTEVTMQGRPAWVSLGYLMQSNSLPCQDSKAGLPRRIMPAYEHKPCALALYSKHDHIMPFRQCEEKPGDLCIALVYIFIW